MREIKGNPVVICEVSAVYGMSTRCGGYLKVNVIITLCSGGDAREGTRPQRGFKCRSTKTNGNM